MSKTSRKIDITPSPTMLDKIGSVDFPIAQAISELIANSLDARIGDEPVTVKVNFSSSKLEIIDNAKGMSMDDPESKDDLVTALTLGATKKTGKEKGMYGLGLKSACSSLGTEMEIETCRVGADKVYSSVLNFKEFSKRAENGNGWMLDAYEMTREDSKYFKEKKSHGTVIIIKGLKSEPKDFNDINKWLSRAYFYHLEHKMDVPYAPEKILQDRILVNGTELEPESFDLIPKTFEIIDFVFKPANAHVTGWIALKKDTNPSKGEYGLHLYRNNQLIESYCKDFTGTHISNDRIIGHIHLDFIDVNYNKLGFHKKGRIWNELAAELKLYLRKFKFASAATHEKTGKNGEKLSNDHVTGKMLEKLGKKPDVLTEEEKKETEEALGKSSPFDGKLIIPVDDVIEKASGKPIQFYGIQLRFQFKNIEDISHPYRWRFHQYDANTGMLSVFINIKSTIYESIVFKDENSGKYNQWEHNIGKAKEALKRIALIESLVQVAEKYEDEIWEKKWNDADHMVDTIIIEAKEGETHSEEGTI